MTGSNFRILLFLLSLPLMGQTAWSNNRIWHGDIEPAFGEAKEKGKFIFLEFSADWCPPCVRAHKEVFDTVEGERLLESFVTVRVDADSLDRWNYRGFVTTNLPTFFLLDSSGRELARITGYDKKEDFVDLMRGFLSSQTISELLEGKIQSHPEDMELRDQLYTFYLTTHQYEKAREVMETVHLLPSEEAWSKYETMRFMEVTSRFNAEPPDYKETITLSNAFTSDFSQSRLLPSLLSYKARALWHLGKKKEAMTLVKSLPKQFPDRSHAYWRLIEFSRLYKTLDKEAKEALEQGLQKFSKEDYFLMQCARWLIQNNDNRRAMRLLEDALKIAPTNSYYKSLLTGFHR